MTNIQGNIVPGNNLIDLVTELFEAGTGTGKAISLSIKKKTRFMPQKKIVTVA